MSDDIYRERTALYYDSVAPGLEGDVDFYVEEARSSGGPVLELGCGTGRILLPIADAGIQVVGLDASRDMLSIARQKLHSFSARDRVTLVQGDMRSFDLGREFKLVIIPFRAFQHLYTVEDQRAALARIHAHLEPGGRLVFNLFDPLLEIIVAHGGALAGVMKLHARIRHPDSGNDVVVTEGRRYDREEQVLHEDRVFEEVDSEGRVLSRQHASLTMRYLFRFEMQHLLELCGFRVEALYGGFRREPFRHGAEQVWIAVRESAR